MMSADERRYSEYDHLRHMALVLITAVQPTCYQKLGTESETACFGQKRHWPAVK